MLVIIHNHPGTPAFIAAESAMDEVCAVKIVPAHTREVWDTQEPQDVIENALADALAEKNLRVDEIDVTFVHDNESERLKISAGARYRRFWYEHRREQS